MKILNCLLYSFLITILYCNITKAETISSYEFKDFNQISSSKNIEEENYEKKKIGLKERFQKFFIGEPTGFTPELYDCPYLNQIGPSYQRGFYGGNGWNNHNIFTPSMIKSF